MDGAWLITFYIWSRDGILALHATKRDLIDSFLEGTDATGRLSAEELLALIR